MRRKRYRKDKFIMDAFFQNLFTVAEQVFILFLLIALGYIVGKTRIFDEHAAKVLGDFCLKFATPAVIIKSFMMEFDPKKAKLLLLALIAAVICHIISIIAANLIFRDNDPKKRALYRCSAVLCNAGFMALPLQEALLGSEGAFYGSAYVIVMSVFLWTYGYSTMGVGKEKMNIKKIILNPGIIAVLIGLPIFIFSIKLPSPIVTAVNHIANLNTPLPMVVVGFYLSCASIKVVAKNPRCFISIFARLVIVPIASIIVLKLLGYGGTMFVSTIVSSCAPIAVAVTMFASSFGGDSELSANTVSISTLLSIITMPIIVALAQTLG